MTTEPDVVDSDPPLEPPPSSFAGSDLTRDSEVPRSTSPPSSKFANKKAQEPEEVPPDATSVTRLKGCPAYENLTMVEKLDVSLSSPSQRIVRFNRSDE